MFQGERLLQYIVCMCGGLRRENGSENKIIGERKVELSKIENWFLSRTWQNAVLDTASTLLRQTAHDYALLLFELHWSFHQSWQQLAISVWACHSLFSQIKVVLLFIHLWGKMWDLVLSSYKNYFMNHICCSNAVFQYWIELIVWI